MSLPPFTLVTGNVNKRREAARLLGYEPPWADIDLPEIQSLDMAEVLNAKGEEAWSRLRGPLVVEETGLELSAMNGFPGPLIKWMLAAVGADGVARTVHALGDDRAVARCGLLYRDADRTVVAMGQSVGRILPAPRGDKGFGWDPIFVPDGLHDTYAELDAETKGRVGHRGAAWQALVERLEIP
ncbi:MAG: non-canonical purine NTP pyrophosphatase [Acidobacteriota bacterium]